MENKIKRVNCEFKVVEQEEKSILTISKKEEKIIFYNENTLLEYIDSDFNKKYRNTLYLIINTLDDEECSDSDVELLYLKVDKLKELILSKYFKYISKDMINKYLKMILLLEEKLNVPRKRRGR